MSSWGCQAQVNPRINQGKTPNDGPVVPGAEAEKGQQTWNEALQLQNWMQACGLLPAK